MARITNALMGDNAYGKGTQGAVLDLRYGGQMGFAPNLSEWVSNQQYVSRNVICLLVEAPTGFQLLQNPDYWVGTLRSLVELHAISITGLNATLEVEYAETPVGGGGEMHEDVTDVKRTRTQVTFSWNEKYGMPVQRFLSGWIRYLIMDPDAKVALINTLSSDASKRVTDMLSDRSAASMIFIEPDPTHTKVMKAWLGTNMMPRTSGEIEAQRDLTAAGEAKKYDVQFTGIFQYGLGVDTLAQKLLNAINITGANPYTRAAFISDIAADVKKQDQGSYGSNVVATGGSKTA